MAIFYKPDGDPAITHIVFSAVFVLIVLFVADLALMPRYRVWSASKAGEAELAQAEYNRQIIVRQAQAEKDAASLKADAEVARAKGVAQANAIIAEGLGGPEGYLRYLYINMLQEQQDKQIIYIPTEAGLPILEAGKRN